MKVNMSPFTGWKVVPQAKAPTKITNSMLVKGSNTMSQPDAMRAAMDGAYHNTQMYGAPKGSL